MRRGSYYAIKIDSLVKANELLVKNEILKKEYELDLQKETYVFYK